MEILNEAAQMLQQEWGMEVPQLISEETILKMLAHRVVELLEKNTETFFQLMYVLDIPEKKVHSAMHEQDFAEQIARLIYDRQIQKIHTRKYFKDARQDPDPDLKW